MPQSDTSKIILAIVMLVIAGALFVYHFRNRETMPSLAPTTEFTNGAIQALEEAFSNVTSKGWKDASAWTDARSAQLLGKDGEDIFGASPSMENIKVLDCGQDGAYTVLTLQVGTIEQCVSVALAKNKNNKFVFNSLSKTLVNVKDFKTYY